MSALDEPRCTRRQYLVLMQIIAGASPVLAHEAVASVAIEHPEWDMDGEQRTWGEWVTRREQRPTTAHGRLT